jgi:hypothetical protein
MSGLAGGRQRRPHHLLQPLNYHRRVRSYDELEEPMEAPVPAPPCVPIVDPS